MEAIRGCDEMELSYLSNIIFIYCDVPCLLYTKMRPLFPFSPHTLLKMKYTNYSKDSRKLLFLFIIIFIFPFFPRGSFVIWFKLLNDHLLLAASEKYAILEINIS